MTPVRIPFRLDRGHSAGFTLVEMMIVLAIIGILLGLAVPSVLQSLENRRVYDAARDVSSLVKSQRIRAQNLNRATGFVVSATNRTVTTFTSAGATCANLAADPGPAIDFDAEHPDASLGSANFDGQLVCIKPDGSVVDPSTSTAFANGPLTYTVGRGDGVGNDFTIVVPYNGLARLDTTQ